MVFACRHLFLTGMFYILDTFTVFFFIKDSCLFFGFFSCVRFQSGTPWRAA